MNNIKENNTYDVAIIGAGASGITSAIYLSRAGLDVALIELGNYGGQIYNTDVIENYTGFTSVSATTLAENMEQQVRSQENVEHIFGRVKNVKKSEDGFELEFRKKSIKSKRVIIATGVKHRKLGIPGEKELDGRGVSYCTVCDGAFFKGKDVVVVGGGDSAVESALYLSKIVNKVTLILRRDVFRAEKVSQDKLKKLDNLEVIYNTTVEEINGDNKVESINVYNKDSGKTGEIETDAVFVNIGVEPVSDTVTELGVTDKEGYIVTDDRMRTEVEDLYAVGDVRQDSIQQIATATGDGAVAADEIVKRLQ